MTPRNPADRPATEPRTLADLDRLAAPLHARVITREAIEELTRLAYEKGRAEAAQGAAPLSPIGDNLADTIAERRARRGAIPATEAGRRLADAAHGLTRLDKPMSRDKARDLIRAEVFAIEAEAAQGAAPRAEGLDVLTRIQAVARRWLDDTDPDARDAMYLIEQEARAALSRPSDERVPEEQE